MALKTDWEQLRSAIEAQLKAQLGELTEGAIADLDGPIREAANRLTVAARSGRQDLVDETKDQLTLIYTKNELKVKSAYSGVFDQFIAVGINALINGAIAGIGAVKAG